MPLSYEFYIATALPASRDGYRPLPGFPEGVEAWHVPAPGYHYQINGPRTADGSCAWVATVTAAAKGWTASYYNPATREHNEFRNPSSKAKRPPRLAFATAAGALAAVVAYHEEAVS